MLSPYAETFYITMENLSHEMDTIEKMNKETDKKKSRKQADNANIKDIPKK